MWLKNCDLFRIVITTYSEGNSELSLSQIIDFPLRKIKLLKLAEPCNREGHYWQTPRGGLQHDHLNQEY